jgi:hypothetical protein
MRKILSLFVMLLTIAFSFGQSEEVITKDGKKVVLKSDKTWEYVINSKSTDDSQMEPEYSNRPYYLNDNELVSFEKVKAKIDIKVKAMGYGGANTYLTAFGVESSTKFTKGKIPKILIKIEGEDEPEDYISILKSEKRKRKKDRRRFKQASMALGGKARDVSENEIDFELKKVSKNIYELIIDETIDFGEYAIIPASNSNGNSLLSYNSSQKIYCFSIK